MESATDYWAARAALAWQVELGADEALSETPVNRFEIKERAKPEVPTRARNPEAAEPAAAPEPPPEAPKVDPVAAARASAEAAGSLEELKAALGAFEHCELRRGARNLVFADGAPGSRVMIIGEAPGREEDREGRPFVGSAGKLLDRMLAAIGLSRAESVYITNVLPWRPPQNREPKPDEIAMMRPFVQRHVQLAGPEIVILMGNISCDAGLQKRGVTRLRGKWTESYGLPAMPMVDPAYLLREPEAKREAWADLLEIKARLET